jgi:hypothetical protein
MPRKKLYKYTIYHDSGKVSAILPRPKMTLEELQAAVRGSIELVPRPYYAHHKWGRCTVYVNEDERRLSPFAEPNPFFEDLGDGFNVVGDAIKEELWHGDDKK